MRIDHIAIWTCNIEKVRDFYLRYFKCESSGKYVNNVKKFSSYFLRFADGAGIELMKRDDITEHRTRVTFGLAHLAIDVGSRQDVNSMTDLMRNEGVEIAGNPRLTGDGYYESVVLDPERNIIEIISK